jgi:hypothetical protein
MENEEADLADDLLTGADEIASFLGPSFTGRKVYHLAEKKALPVFRLPGGRTLYGRKSQLRRTFSAASEAAVA